MAVYTTEIASSTEASDNPIHQRLLYPYHHILPQLSGSLLEVGCGEGRGVELMLPRVAHFSAIDKIKEVTDRLAKQFPTAKFCSGHIPPLKDFADNTFDFVVSFQVIEHIQDDASYLQEIHRVLKPGGKAFFTTPNRPMSLSRNPWHIREYTAHELTQLASRIFAHVSMQGISGNEKVMAYYEENKKSVNRIMRWDVLDLQHRLPARILRIPYELLNRMNRRKLQTNHASTVQAISIQDFFVTEKGEDGIDLFLTVMK